MPIDWHFQLIFIILINTIYLLKRLCVILSKKAMHAGWYQFKFGSLGLRMKIMVEHEAK